MTGPSTVGIVLAGGASTRFGGDKLAVLLDGRPLLHYALEAVAAVADQVLLVVAMDAPAPDLPETRRSRVTVARDDRPLGGPLAGLAAGLRALTADPAARPGDLALVVGGDMPTLVPAVLRRLLERLADDPRLVALTLEADRSSPLPMALRPSPALHAIDALMDAGGRRSLLALLEAVPSATLPAAEWRALDPDAATLRDVDRREDLPGA